MRKAEKYIYAVVTIILIVLSSTATYFVVKKSDNTEVKANNSATNKKEEQDNKDNQNKNEVEKELELNDAKVEKAYKIVGLNNNRMQETGFYESKKMTYDNLPNKQAFAYDYRELSIKETKNYSSCDEVLDYYSLYHDCMNDDSILKYGINVDSGGFNIIEAKELEKTYKEIFGSDKSMAKEDFSNYYARECSRFDYDKKSDTYIHIESGCGADLGGHNTKLIKATLKGNEMTLYDKHVVNFCGGCEYYKDITEKEVVSEVGIIITDDIIEKGQIYKHVFEANSDGTYHWVSSEPVDSI